MSEQAINQAEIDAVFPKVAQVVADALGCELDEVTPKASLIADLDAESIDFLDLVFRLEKGFGVKIPRGKIVEDARGPLPESEFETKGIVTEAGNVRAQSVKVYLDTARVPGWNEIDAVQIIGRDGSKQWATTSRASSSYPDRESLGPRATGSPNGPLSSPTLKVRITKVSSPRLGPPASASPMP